MRQLTSHKKIPFLNLVAQNSEVKNDLLIAFEEVLDSGSYISGSRVSSFEKAFGEKLRIPYSVACNSGTSALILGLQALGIGPGDEVLVPGMTFIASVEAIVAVGATPIVIDVDKNTWNLNIELAKENLTKKTKAMIFVHLHGNPVGVLGAVDFCKINGIYLIEDAAQAHLAQIKNRYVGTFGHIAAFSFYPGKNLGAIGEGGCLVTRDSNVHDKAKLIRNWGSREKYLHETRGSNFRMDEIQAAFLEIKLSQLDKWTEHRTILSAIYNDFFDHHGIQRPYTSKEVRHVFHIYSIVIDSRDDFRKFLIENSIETGIHYPSPVGELTPWVDYFGRTPQTPVSRELSEGFVSLPLSDQHSKEDVYRVIEVVGEYFALNLT